LENHEPDSEDAEGFVPALFAERAGDFAARESGESMNPVQIIIGGDICPIGRNATFFKKGDAAGAFRDLLPAFKAADLSVANLECPLIEEQTPIVKTGPVIGAEPGCIAGIAAAGVRVLGLANNHILDHGAAGLENTLRICAKTGIRTFGAGGNLAEAREILVVRAGPLRVALLGVADQEWSIATENAPGANPLDLIDCVRKIAQRRNDFDFLIVLLHGGVEGYPFPSPHLRDVCRFLIEQGAGMVVCQHSHRAGCYEAHGRGHIVYGQGNLIFDAPGNAENWEEGFLIQLSIDPQDLRAKWQPIPYIQSDALPGARRMPPGRETDFLQELDERSRAIQEKGFVSESWERFCRAQQHSFMSATLGHGRVLRRLNRHGRLVKHLLSEETLRTMKNCVRCEAHREVLLTVLDQYLEPAERATK
jgi:poly-gamma-glutamate synthesis protein (capsule biosynthesis protein)